jgi:hypothetical protein
MLTNNRLVLETLEPLPGDRKCFRMINGVLTERTVEEVVPILKTNSDGLKKTLEELVKQYKTRQDEMEKWKVCGLSCSKDCLLIMTRAEAEQHPGSSAAAPVERRALLMQSAITEMETRSMFKTIWHYNNTGRTRTSVSLGMPWRHDGSHHLTWSYNDDTSSTSSPWWHHSILKVVLK